MLQALLSPVAPRHTSSARCTPRSSPAAAAARAPAPLPQQQRAPPRSAGMRGSTREQQPLAKSRSSSSDDGDAAPQPGGSGGGSGGGSARLLLLGGLVVTAGLILASSGGLAGLKERVADLEALVASSGAAGPAIFVAAYSAATVLLFPASLLTLAAGYLFGPLKGTALVSVSATTGACLAFLVSRYIARPAVEAKLTEFPRFQAIYNSISSDGVRLVLLLRLSPLVPFSLLNYGLGITNVRFLEYAAASWAGMLPGTFAYVYLGSLGKVAADAAGDAAGAGGGFDAIKLGLYVVGAAATIAATKLISNAASAAIDKEGADGAAGGGAGGDSRS